MARDISDFIGTDTLQQIQDAFSVVAGVPLRICSPDGTPLLADSEALPDWRIAGDIPSNGGLSEPRDVTVDFRAPVTVNDLTLATVQLAPDPDSPAGATAVEPGRMLHLLRLAANLISRLCERQEQLRDRIDELTALYKLTAEFAGQRDLQSLLDLVAKTVVDALQAKASTIRLLSEDRNELLVSAVHNLSAEYLEKGPVLLTASEIDTEVLRTGEPVYVADHRHDPRVIYPVEAEREGLVSALCAPMIYKDRAEGVLRVYTSEPHEFDRFEVSLLKSIASQAASAIANARLNEEARESRRLRRTLNMAAEVQRRMLPQKLPEIPGFDVGAVYVPSYELGGDFYDFIDLPANNVGVAICDVVGKGVRASLLTASIRSTLRAHAMNLYEMSEVLDRVNRDLCATTQIGDFATLFYGVLDAQGRKFTYANAGHLPPLLVRDGKLCHLSTSGGVIGIDADFKYTHEWFGLRSGDVIVGFTDGLTEALNFRDEPFGLERVQEATLAAVGQGQSAQGIARFLLWEMRRFAGLQTRMDDLTLVVIRVL